MPVESQSDHQQSIAAPIERPLLHIQRLSHSYGQRVALDALSLDVARGEIFGLLGPNGSGKTTLFRVLSTLVPPQSGTIRFELDGAGRELPRDRLEVRRRMGIVFQSPSLDVQLTARENLMHQGHLYGIRGEELRRRSDELLDRFGLRDRAGERIKGFSGGMRRRVELAKGLLHRPAFLLLDEPSTGLDPAARLDVWHYLEEIRERDGVTVLLTTHLMEEADKCDRLGILSHGKLLACDTPAALKDRIGGDVIWVSGADLAALRTAIRERLSIDAEMVDGALRIERANAHQFVPMLVESLPGMIDSVSLSKPTLEDVFIQTTGHRFRDEE